MRDAAISFYPTSPAIYNTQPMRMNMSETPRTDFMLRQAIFNEAQDITYYQTALSVVPQSPENHSVCKQYRSAFNEACEKMWSLLSEYQPIHPEVFDVED
jgi:hypothetical protein